MPTNTIIEAPQIEEEDSGKFANTVSLYKKGDSNLIIKKGIWLYFILLIIEGGLRRWILPGLSAPLLIIRDPVAIWLIVISIQRGVLPKSFYMYAMAVFGFVSFYLAIFAGHGNMLVALYGLRIFVVHFPVMFIMGKIFSREDVIKMGKVILYIALPMTLLIIVQFHKPPDAWVNKGVGDNITASFGGAGEFFRPPGTFSFITGTALFYGLVSAFVFYFLLHPGLVNKNVLIAVTICLGLSIPYSISRSLFFEVFVGMVFMVIAVFKKPQYFGKMITFMIVGVVMVIALSQLSSFKTASGAFTDRFTGANKTEGGLVKGVILDRYLGGLVGALTNTDKIPFFGYGLGYGSAVAGFLLTGKAGRVLGEGDWGRIVGEIGALFGFMVILIRVSFVWDLFVRSIRKYTEGDLLPWMLLSFAILVVPQGEWAQPTSLGFSTLIGGLLLAAVNHKPVRNRPAQVVTQFNYNNE